MARSKRSHSDMELTEDSIAAQLLRQVAHVGAQAAALKACMQCGATKTPQWREGPLGPKTLCNACGVKRVRALKAIAEGRKPPASPQQRKAAAQRQRQQEQSADLAAALQLLAAKAEGASRGPMRQAAVRAIRRAVEIGFDVEEPSQQQQQGQEADQQRLLNQQLFAHCKTSLTGGWGRWAGGWGSCGAWRFSVSTYNRCCSPSHHCCGAVPQLCVATCLFCLAPTYAPPLSSHAAAAADSVPTDSGEEISWSPDDLLRHHQQYWQQHHQQQQLLAQARGAEELEELEADAAANLLSISQHMPAAEAATPAQSEQQPQQLAQAQQQQQEGGAEPLLALLSAAPACLAQLLPQGQYVELLRLQAAADERQRASAAADAAVAAVARILEAKQQEAQCAHAASLATAQQLQTLLSSLEAQHGLRELAAGLAALSAAGAASAAEQRR